MLFTRDPAELKANHGNRIRFTLTTSSMIRLGQLLQDAVSPQPFYTQMCFSHALHLAVLDSLSANPQAQNEAHYRVDEIAGDEEADSHDLDIGDDLDSAENDLPEQESRAHTGLYSQLVCRLRTACLYLAKSAAKNGSLLRARRQCGKKELKVLLSCRTRWNSILQMLQKFVELRPQMQIAYRNQKNTFPVKTADDANIKGMVNSVSLIKKPVKMISSEDATFLDAP
jgi:hypothetical protein